MNIHFPIIISASGDIAVFNSIEKAENYYEPYDIDSLIGFDNQGYILEFEVQKRIHRVIGIATEIERIAIKVKEEKIDLEESRKLIIEYVSRIRSVNHRPFLQRDWNQLTIPELIEVIKKIATSEPNTHLST